MAFKMKGTAMYDKTMVDGKSMMNLKKEFGGAMEMKSPMDAAKPDYIDIDGDGNKKESMKEAAAAMPMKSPMDMSPKKLTQDAAMKLTSEIKKSGMPLTEEEEDESPMNFGVMGVARSVMGNKPMSGLGGIAMRNARRRR